MAWVPKEHAGRDRGIVLRCVKVENVVSAVSFAGRLRFENRGGRGLVCKDATRCYLRQLVSVLYTSSLLVPFGVNGPRGVQVLQVQPTACDETAAG